MLLCGSQNKYGMGRRLFKGFKKSIKCSLGEHVYLIYNIDTIAANLRRDPHLFSKGPYIIY